MREWDRAQAGNANDCGATRSASAPPEITAAGGAGALRRWNDSTENTLARGLLSRLLSAI